MLPEAFTKIKHKIESSSVLSADERKEWLSLLPTMTEMQLRELDRILAVTPPAAPVPGPKVFTLENLDALTLEDFHHAPSAHKFLTDLNSQIKLMPAVEAEAAFEKSPFYRSYVEAGVKLMAGTPAELTREEVEAITDFRQNLRKLLN